MIFLSIGYGPDAKDGKLRLNFGPLNGKSGRRRLNVAVTRARIKCVTVASFRPEQLRDSAQGLQLLREYMEYARSGRLNGDSFPISEAREEDLFVQAVATALTQRGYSVRQNVGLFDFRVDIGVLDDENPDRFLLGIECDGAHYVSGETARARDYLRDDVLRGLEWRLLRIWSADWARDSAAVLQSIEAAIERAKHGEPDAPIETPAPIPKIEWETAAQKDDSEAENASETVEIVAPETNNSLPAQTSGLYPGLTFFTPMSDTNLAKLARAFWACGPTEQAALLTRLVEAEGPLPFGVAAQKIANAAGYTRAGNRLQQTVREAANGAIASNAVEEMDGFLWPSGLARNPPARVPRVGDAPRPIEQICLEEIGAVMVALLRAAIGMGQNEAIDETTRLLGFARTGPAVRERITEALSLLEISHQAHVRGGQVYTFDV